MVIVVRILIYADEIIEFCIEAYLVLHLRLIFWAY